jgi:hypothetical protein
MKSWEYDALKDDHRRTEITSVEVECYEDGTPVPEGVESEEQTYMDTWYQCSCGQKYKTEDEAVECCFPHYHVDYEE